MEQELVKVKIMGRQPGKPEAVTHISTLLEGFGPLELTPSGATGQPVLHRAALPHSKTGIGLRCARLGWYQAEVGAGVVFAIGGNILLDLLKQYFSAGDAGQQRTP